MSRKKKSSGGDPRKRASAGAPLVLTQETKAMLRVALTAPDPVKLSVLWLMALERYDSLGGSYLNALVKAFLDNPATPVETLVAIEHFVELTAEPAQHRQFVATLERRYRDDPAPLQSISDHPDYNMRADDGVVSFILRALTATEEPKKVEALWLFTRALLASEETNLAELVDAFLSHPEVPPEVFAEAVQWSE